MVERNGVAASDRAREVSRNTSGLDLPGGGPTPEDSLPLVRRNALLFEVGWEVCWQLGGIYTVLRTKARQMLDRWGDRYALVGPYNPTTAATEFDETPPDGIWREILNEAGRQGLTVRHGRWLVPGRPRTILIDHRARFGRLHEDKYLLYADHGITTDADDGEVNETVAFGFAVTQFLKVAAEINSRGDRATLAHFHEWMAGVAIPRIAHLGLPIQTIFTTHATLLGRYLAGDDPRFYDHLPFYEADAEASKYGIGPRHQLEKAAAHASTVFTTVSEVTAREAEHLLGRIPDELLPNGLDIEGFEAPHEFHHLHDQYKQEIHNFVRGHFFPSAPFDLDRTIYLFTSGRYEYRNKGLDLFVESLWRLNQRLRWARDHDGETIPTVVAFIISRVPVRSVNVETLANQAQLDELRRTCDELKEQIGRRLFEEASRGNMVGRGDLIDEDAEITLKRAINAARVRRYPSVVTHDLIDDAADPVLAHLRHRELINKPDDPVKVVFHPQFLTSTSPLISLDYGQFVRGCHMGVFPSYYEPWGYTPMEAMASGLPSVTSDLAGFGSYWRTLEQYDFQPPGYIPHVPGVLVLDRHRRPFGESVEQLMEHLFNFAKFTRRQRIEMRNRVEKLAGSFDWSVLSRHYHRVHDLALAHLTGDAPQRGEVEVRTV
jgi:glycogen(starch) synthase